MSKELGWCYKHRFKFTKQTLKTKENRCLECNYTRRYPVEYWLVYEVDKIKKKIVAMNGKPDVQKRLKETIDLLKRKHSLGVTIDPRNEAKRKAMYTLPIKSKRLPYMGHPITGE
jgi:hypothetical protein